MAEASPMPKSFQSKLNNDNPEEQEFQHALSLLDTIESSTDRISGLEVWLDHLLDCNLSIVSKRSLLALLVKSLRKDVSMVQLSVGKYSVEALRSVVASFDEQDAEFRNLLADAYTENEEYVEAAKILQGIQLESSQRKVNDADKFNMWIRICRLYLEEDDTTTAESYLNRAKNLLYQIDDRESQLKFKLSQARISDAQRRFLEAGAVYHEISLTTLLADEERDLTLAKAIISAVLAPAGTPRTSLLRKLYRDDRSQNLSEYGMLESMYLGRLISPIQSDTFAKKLALHQTTEDSDGSTVLAKAVVEHNLLGISNTYESIGILELGRLLGLSARQTEAYSARMIQQGRLNAHIDHVSGYIHLHRVDEMGKFSRFDEGVRLLLEEVERVSSLIPLNGDRHSE